MIKIFLILILILTTSNARENPFFPIVGEKDIPVTSNEDRTKSPLNRATITLPAQARVVQKITVEYKTLDGSIENKSIELDNSIDWHLPLFISQSYSSTTEPTIEMQSPSKEEKYINIASTKHLQLLALDRKLKLLTKDKIIRDFILLNPHRLVIDFKKDTDIKSYIKQSSNTIFNRVRVGNHKGYYRAVIELDGVYRYDMQKRDYGYFLELK